MDLYSPVIKQLNADPTNFGQLVDAAHEVRAINNFCGDKFVIRLAYNGRVEAVMFNGYGCAVSKASADILSDCVKGKTWAEISEICDQAVSFLSGQRELNNLDKRLESFAVVRNYPGRFDCAALAWTEMKEYATGRIGV